MALLVQITLGILSMMAPGLYHDFGAWGILQILGVLAIALLWGVGPSLCATLTGVAIIALFHIHQFSQVTVVAVSDLMVLGIYLVVGCAISFLVSWAIHAQQVADATCMTTEQLAQSYQRGENRLTAIIDAVPDELAIHDDQGMLIQINQAAHEASGISAQSLPAHTVADMLPLWTLTGQQVTEQDIPLNAAARGERIREVEYMKYLPCGQKRYLAVSITPIALADGVVEEVVVISHDITELKQEQQAEAQRANEFEVLFDSLVDAVMVMDTEGRIVRANAAYKQFASDLRVLNLTLRERMAYLDIHTDQGAGISLEEMPNMRILRGDVLQGPTAVDLRVHSPSQGILYHNANGAPLRNAAGEITGGVMVLRDVTERRQWERRTRDALDALVAIASEIVRMPIDQEEAAENVAQRIAEITWHVLNCYHVIITTVNPPNEGISFAATIGLPSEQTAQLQTHVEGRALGEFLTIDQIARLQRGEVFSITMPTAPALAGLEFLGSSVLMAPMLIEGRLIGMINANFQTQDAPITPEDRLVAATIAKLSALVLERKRLLHQQAVAQARILAMQQAKERMDIFLNMASHELRTPLTSVMGYIQLARKRLSRQLAEEQNHHAAQTTQLLSLLDDADMQATFLNRLVGDLLEASRAEGRKLSLHPVACTITDIVQEAIAGQQAIFPDRHISLQQEEETLLVLADRGRIIQVLMNYLSNAVKYSPADSLVLVKLHRDGESIRVVVYDRGSGISLEEQEHIWERFYRSESQVGVIPGLGMGLYLSRMIIEQHGGQVGVESRVGEGSQFWFTLPLYRKEPGEKAPCRD